MSARIPTRGARSLISHSQALRASSSQAGPSTSSAAPSPRRLPRETLRSLVSLHHTSSSFLQNPSQLTEAFSTAFRSPSAEITSYYTFSQIAKESVARPAYTPYDPSSGSAPGRLGRSGTEEFLRVKAAKLPRPVFGWQASKWSDGASRQEEGLYTEREVQVREAMWGTWDRGVSEISRPGLEGVEEYLEKKGVEVEASAKEWGERDKAV